VNRLEINFTARGSRSPWLRRILIVLALAL